MTRAAEKPTPADGRARQIKGAPGIWFLSLCALALGALGVTAFLWMRPLPDVAAQRARGLPENWHGDGLPALAPFDSGVIARFRLAPENAIPAELGDDLALRWEEFRGPFSPLPEATRLVAYFSAREVVISCGAQKDEWAVALLNGWESPTLADKLDPILERLTALRPATFTPLRADGVSVQHWRFPGPSPDVTAPEFWLSMHGQAFILAGRQDTAAKWAGLLGSAAVPEDAPPTNAISRKPACNTWQPETAENAAAHILDFLDSRPSI